MRRLLIGAGRGLLVLVLLGTGLWSALALYYRLPLPEGGRIVAAAAWGLAALGVIGRPWRPFHGKAVATYALAFALLLVWWGRIGPSDTRDWADDVARHIEPSVAGPVVTLRNVRNFDWRSDEDYTVRWETRQYDLDHLRSVDMALSYWMGPAIAHTLVSFGFDDGQGGTRYLVFSVEIRKERGESFSAVAGFFKQFELALVAADERDVLRVRTNVRGEDVYLYRVAMPPEALRSLFLAYLDQSTTLAAHPRFYSTLTANCTTIVFDMARRIVGGLPLDWRLLASGYLPEYLQSIDGLAARADLDTLRAAGRIAERAKAADADPRFSQAIRRGIPGMETGR